MAVYHGDGDAVCLGYTSAAAYKIDLSPLPGALLNVPPFQASAGHGDAPNRLRIRNPGRTLNSGTRVPGVERDARRGRASDVALVARSALERNAGRGRSHAEPAPDPSFGTRTLLCRLSRLCDAAGPPLHARPPNGRELDRDGSHSYGFVQRLVGQAAAPSQAHLVAPLPRGKPPGTVGPIRGDAAPRRTGLSTPGRPYDQRGGPPRPAGHPHAPPIGGMQRENACVRTLFSMSPSNRLQP